MNKVQIYCWSKVYIIQAVFGFGCDSFLTMVVFSRLRYQTWLGTSNSIFETSAKTIHRLVLFNVYNRLVLFNVYKQTAGLREYKAFSLFCNV